MSRRQLLLSLTLILAGTACVLAYAWNSGSWSLRAEGGSVQPADSEDAPAEDHHGNVYATLRFRPMLEGRPVAGRDYMSLASFKTSDGYNLMGDRRATHDSDGWYNVSFMPAIAGEVSFSVLLTDPPGWGSAEGIEFAPVRAGRTANIGEIELRFAPGIPMEIDLVDDEGFDD